MDGILSKPVGERFLTMLERKKEKREAVVGKFKLRLAVRLKWVIRKLVLKQPSLDSTTLNFSGSFQLLNFFL